MRRTYAVIVVLAAMLSGGAGTILGEVTVTELDKGKGVTHLRVANEYFDMEFTPETAAQTASFKTRYSTNEWIFPGEYGMFRDRFVGQYSYGELAQARYDFRFLERSPEKAVIEFKTMTGGNVLFSRTMTFEANSPVVRVRLGLVNQGALSAVRGLWPQSLMYISGVKENNRYFRPSNRGINEAGWNEKTQYMGGDDYVKAPYAGWTAALNTGTGEGLVWLVDYHWLKWLYNCPVAWTAEWVYDYTSIPPQEKWETEYDMILVKGFPSLCHASSNLIAGMTMEPSKQGDASSELVITHILGRSMAGEFRNAKLTATLRGVDSADKHALPELDAGTLSWDPKKLNHTLKVNMDQRLVCEAVLTGTDAGGKPVREEYSYYWPGIKGEKFDLVSGTTATTYLRKPPRKVKNFSKPKNLVYFRKPEVRMLEFRGPFHYGFRVPEAATRAGIGDIRGSYFSSSWSGNAVNYLPASFEEMFEYDLLVMNDVDAICLTEFGLEMVKEFVGKGGSLLVLGGPYAFGPGAYSETPLAEILPVTWENRSFDLKQADPPSSLKVAPSAQVMKDARLKNKGRCFWYQTVQSKTNATVELTAGDIPFLVCGKYGDGKVAVVAGNVMGDSSKAKPGFWESDEWVDTLSRVIRWMVFGN